MPTKIKNRHLNEYSKQPPFSRFLVADTTNVDEALEAASKAYCDHRQKLTGKADSFRFRLHSAPLQKSAINWLSYGANISIDPGQTDTFFMIMLPQTGSAKYWHGGQTCEATQSMGMVASPTLPLHFNITETCDQFSVKINRKALEDHLCALTGVPITEPIIFQPHRKTNALAYSVLNRPR